jgi:hypothetical protein
LVTSSYRVRSGVGLLWLALSMELEAVRVILAEVLVSGCRKVDEWVRFI